MYIKPVIEVPCYIIGEFSIFIQFYKFESKCKPNVTFEELRDKLYCNQSEPFLLTMVVV